MTINSLDKFKSLSFKEDSYKDCLPDPNDTVSKLNNICNTIQLFIEKNFNIPSQKSESIINSIKLIIKQYVIDFNYFINNRKNINLDIKQSIDIIKCNSDKFIKSVNNMIDVMEDYFLTPIIYNKEQDKYCSIFKREWKYVSKICSFCAFDQNNNICCYFDRNDYDRIMYKRLFSSTLSLIHKINDILCLDNYNYKASYIRFIISPILSYVNIYESLYPSGNCLKQQMLDTLDMLTDSSCQPMNTIQGGNKLFLETLDLVFNDIKENKLNYIKNISRALYIFKNKNLTNYQDSDYYVSMKASPSKINFNGERLIIPSLQKSCFEVDFIKSVPEIKAFDDYVNYRSSYVSKDILKDYNFDISDNMISTTFIRNNGKFKDRAIHYAINPIQDRCNYLHNRLQFLHNLLPESSVLDQMRGVKFLQKITNLWKINNDNEKDNFSLHCADFSNATDTLDQQCQYKVINFVLGKECADMFNYIAQLPKHLVNLQGQSDLNGHSVDIIYQQKYGQPQGILGSFDAFHLAHYFILLCAMKLSDMEDIHSDQVFAILGDDLVMTTVNYDPNDILWRNYVNLSTSCNLKINLDKSDHVYPDSDYAELDFAKVQVRNGEIVSPIPYRLISNSYKREILYSIAFYALNKELDYADSLFNIILDQDQNQDFADFIRACYNKGLLSFITTKKEIDVEPSDTLLIFFINLVLLYKKIFNLLKTNKKSSTNIKTLDNLLMGYQRSITDKKEYKEIIPSYLNNLDPYHKINDLRYKNMILSELKELYIKTLDPKLDFNLDLVFDVLCQDNIDIDPDIRMMYINLLSLYEDLQKVENLQQFYDWCDVYFHTIPLKQFAKSLSDLSSHNLLTADTKAPISTFICFEKAYKSISSFVLYYKLKGITNVPTIDTVET